MNAQATIDSWQAAFDARTTAGDEAPWLAARRTAGLEHFRRLGFPTTRDEDWLNTSVAHLARNAWTPAPPPSPRQREAAAVLLDERVPGPATASGRMVFVNGWYAPELSDVESLPVGVRVDPLSAVAGALEGELAALTDGRDHAFQALNTALWTDGARVRLARDVHLPEPLHLAFLVVGGDDHAMVHPRVVVRGETGSHAPIVLTWAGATEASVLQNSVLEVELEARARIDLLEVQRLPRTVSHFAGLSVHQERDSTFTACCIADGARLARSDVSVRLDAEGAACRLDGVTVVSSRQHVDVLTRIDHAKPHGRSEQLYKGILDDHARTAFAGKVLVRPGAQKTDARQANHNLLLSRDAIADSKPQLEIFADDVKCAHGATVGQLDDEAVFYLRSRGLDLLEARKLLVKAFAFEVAERIEHPTLHDHAQATLHAIL